MGILIKVNTFTIQINLKMRRNGTIYPVIKQLPANALPVSAFAEREKTAVGYVYTKYKRYLEGKGQDPGYEIRCFMGSNYIIPTK